MRWNWRDIVSIVVLPVVVFIALIIPPWVAHRIDSIQVELACTSAKANISQLDALAALERRLGIPVDFKVPRLPEECP